MLHNKRDGVVSFQIIELPLDDADRVIARKEAQPLFQLGEDAIALSMRRALVMSTVTTPIGTAGGLATESGSSDLQLSARLKRKRPRLLLIPGAEPPPIR